jgi:hypothetical protein
MSKGEIRPCSMCGNKNGVWHEESGRHLCAKHWNLVTGHDPQDPTTWSKDHPARKNLRSEK